MLQQTIKKVMHSFVPLNIRQGLRGDLVNTAHPRPKEHQAYHVQPQRRDSWLGIHRKVLTRRAA